jgi:hypothetical protein
MGFHVLAGVPHIEELWNYLMAGLTHGSLTNPERELAKKFAKALRHLESNPYHPGLQSHEIDALTARYGQKVFQSYLENNTPGAGRLFWVYGPDRGQITVIGLEPHPEDAKRGAYARVQLSALPPAKSGPDSPPRSGDLSA